MRWCAGGGGAGNRALARRGERRAGSVAPKHRVESGAGCGELGVPEVGVRLAARAPRAVRGVTRRGHTLQAGKLQGEENGGRARRSTTRTTFWRILMSGRKPGGSEKSEGSDVRRLDDDSDSSGCIARRIE